MWIALRTIGPSGVQIEQICPNRWLDEIFRGVDVPLAHPPSRIQLHIHRQQSLITVQGTFWIYAQLTCVRCAESMTYCLTDFVDAKLLPRSTPDQRRVAVNASAHHDEVSQGDCDMVYDNDGFSLLELLRPEILMALPILPMCREHCLGLCTTCGQNLNMKLCTCSPQQDRLEGFASCP